MSFSKPGAMQFSLGIIGIGFLSLLPLHAYCADIPDTTLSHQIVVHDGEFGSTDAPNDYDPWEPFNEKIFLFNAAVDIYVLRPIATGYNSVVADGEKDAIHNILANVAMPKRLINSLLQGKFGGAARELARFLINSTLGVGGMADVAKYQFHIEMSDEDGGKTLAHYGIRPGPYLVLPFLRPLTVRDGLGYVLDLDPINFFAPLLATFTAQIEDIINRRALMLKSQGLDLTIDHYSAIRNRYLTNRQYQLNNSVVTDEPAIIAHGF